MFDVTNRMKMTTLIMVLLHLLYNALPVFEKNRRQASEAGAFMVQKGGPVTLQTEKTCPYL
jgi:hypothetical protein